ncbi:11217_t:CDS:2, partial [Cetraspora pellucida]
PTSLQECSFLTTKAALFHVHTSPSKNNSTPKTTLFTPDYSIFQLNQQYTTTFKKTIPLNILNELALKADQKFAKINNLEINPK